MSGLHGTEPLPFGAHGLVCGCLLLWCALPGSPRCLPPCHLCLGMCLLSPGVVLGPTLGWGVWREVLTFPSSIP